MITVFYYYFALLVFFLALSYYYIIIIIMIIIVSIQGKDHTKLIRGVTGWPPGDPRVTPGWPPGGAAGRASLSWPGGTWSLNVYAVVCPPQWNCHIKIFIPESPSVSFDDDDGDDDILLF